MELELCVDYTGSGWDQEHRLSQAEAVLHDGNTRTLSKAVDS